MNSIIEKYTPDDYIAEVIDHLESLEFEMLAYPLSIKMVANTITTLAMHCALCGQSPRMAAITIWSTMMNGYKQAIQEGGSTIH